MGSIIGLVTGVRTLAWRRGRAHDRLVGPKGRVFWRKRRGHAKQLRLLPRQKDL
jgi:hypothetical protein